MRVSAQKWVALYIEDITRWHEDIGTPFFQRSLLRNPIPLTRYFQILLPVAVKKIPVVKDIKIPIPSTENYPLYRLVQ